MVYPAVDKQGPMQGGGVYPAVDKQGPISGGRVYPAVYNYDLFQGEECIQQWIN